MLDIRRMDHFHYDVIFSSSNGLEGVYNEYELRQLREDLYAAISRINELLGINETID